MKKANSIYIIASVFAVISLILFALLIQPTLNQIEKNSQDLIAAKNDIATLAAQTVEVSNFKKNYTGYKPNLDRIDGMFIDPNNPAEFIKFLEKTTSDFGLTCQISLPPSSGAQKSKQDFVTFQVVSRGSFSATTNFMKEIEKGPYLLEIESLSIQNSITPPAGISIVAALKSMKDYSARTVEATFITKVFIKK